MHIPEKNEQYGSKEYWDQRYTHESDDSSFDWFKSYGEVATIIRDLIPDTRARILMLGCGNSRFSEEMWDDGYRRIVNIDVGTFFLAANPSVTVNLTWRTNKYSSVVVHQMRRRHEAIRPDMEWHEMDVRHICFKDETFDVVIDKGTMDAMMTSEGDVWDPSQQTVEDCTKEVDEAIRVLRKNGGIFLYITFGQPHFRRRFLTRPNTTLEVKELGEAFHYYLYILRT